MCTSADFALSLQMVQLVLEALLFVIAVQQLE